jgi:peptidyl-prolyl cis-trans isomerase SurA
MSMSSAGELFFCGLSYRKLFRATMLLAAAVMVLPSGTAAGAETVDRIVAVVNGEIIVLSELRPISQNYMRQMSEQFKVEAGDEQFREAERRILDQLIDEKLVNQEADRLTITISEREIDTAVKEMQNRNKLNDAQFAAVLADEGLTMPKYREQLKGQMKKVRVIDQEIKSRIQVSKEEIEAYYEKHASDFNAEPEVRIQQIRLVISPEAGEKEINRIQAQAESILSKIKGGEDFTSLVNLYSQDPSASAGGDMGVFKRGELLPAIDEYAFGMKPGEVSPVIKTEGGFHIVKVLARREPSALTEEERRAEVKDVIFSQKAEELFKEWIAKLRKKAYIEVNL